MPKISALTSLAQASVDTAADVLPIVDATAPATTKKVTVQAMVNAGLAAAAPQGGIFALTGALTVSGTSTLGITRVSGADNSPQFGVSGATRGVRFITSSFGSAIEGVDNTLGASYQPLNIVASVLGLYTTGGNAIALGTSSGTPQMYVTNTTSAVNFAQITGGVTGNAVRYGVGGSDSNIAWAASSKGTFGLGLYTNDFTNLQFAVSHTASAVNYYSVNGGATGVQPGFAATGSDVNVSSAFTTKGTGGHFFSTNTFGATQFVVAHTANAVNYAQITGSATGNAVRYGVEGSDSNVTWAASSKGTFGLGFYTNSFSQLQFAVGHIASAVNYLQAAGSTTGNEARLSVQGSDTNAGMWVTTKGTGVIRLETGGGEQFRVSHVANAVNRITAYGNATGGAPSLFAEGSDTNISFGLYSKGSGGVFAAVRGAVSAYFDNPASPVNYATITGSATGNAVAYGVAGTDANIGLKYATKGTGAHSFLTNGSTEQFRVVHLANAVNLWTTFGNVTAGAPSLYADGSDASVNAAYGLKGSGSHIFLTGTGSLAQLLVTHTASAVNYAQITGAATGNAVTISGAGSDANIDFAIAPKGTGVLRFGTHSAIAAETVTGYITIKDSAGNTRKLAVLS